MTPFQFKTKLDQPHLLGRKARNLSELLSGIQSVPTASIYHHTHRYLRQHHFLSPEPPNDFGYWITEALNEALLGERISSVDIVHFATLEELRDAFTRILQAHLKATERSPIAPAGQEFHFVAARTYVLTTPYVAHTPSEFRTLLRQIDINSLHFHIFEARLGLGNRENDFAAWFRELGRTELADKITRLDPYTHTLEGLRNTLIQLVGADETD
jgi:hypothetical protein